MLIFKMTLDWFRVNKLLDILQKLPGSPKYLVLTVSFHKIKMFTTFESNITALHPPTVKKYTFSSGQFMLILKAAKFLKKLKKSNNKKGI